MRHLVSLVFCSLAFTPVSFAQNENTAAKVLLPHTIGKLETTKNGMQYVFWKDEKGTTPEIGDIISYNMRAQIGDSILFDSRKLNEGQSMEMPLVSNPEANKAMDPTEVIKMLSPGDSVTIYVKLDSAAHSMFTFAKPDDKLKFEFAMVSVKSKQQYDADMSAHGSTQAATDDKVLREYFAKNKIVAQKTATGLYYVITKKGIGLNPKAGATVKVNYTGKNLKGKLFDSNIEPEFQHTEPLEFLLGKGMVIAGWDEGIALLNKGSKATLYIPSGLAYGSSSPSPLISADEILIFDVELLSFQ